MSLISSLSPNGSISGPIPNVAAQAVAPVSNSAETPTAARSILQSAVSSASLVPNYSTETPRNPTQNDDPSSALAAQFIAQTPDATDEQLAVFVPRGVPTPIATNGEDTRALNSLRIERGEIDPPLAPVITPVPIKAANDNVAIATSTTTSKNSEAAATTYAASQTTSEVRPPQKKSTIVQARGASAYQLASSRNTPQLASSFETILS